MSHSIFQPKWTKGSKAARFEQLKSFFKNKDILDLGCAVGYQQEDWMHRKIVDVADSVYGLDMDEKAINKIISLGFNVHLGDAQNFNLNKKFSLIHAGELIEHLENSGNMIKCAKEHLTEDGLFLITTPNALRISNFVYASTGGLKVNTEHTCWFCEYTLSALLNRYGFNVVKVDYLKHETFNFLRKGIRKIREHVLPQRVASNTLVIVAQLK